MSEYDYGNPDQQQDGSAQAAPSAEPMVDAAQPGETAATAGLAPDVAAEPAVDAAPTGDGSVQPGPDLDPTTGQEAGDPGVTTNQEASGTLPDVDPVAQAHADLNAARVAAGLQAATSEEAGDLDRSALDEQPPAESQG